MALMRAHFLALPVVAASVILCSFSLRAAGTPAAVADAERRATATVYLEESGRFSVARGVADEDKGLAFGSWSTAGGWDVLDISAGRRTVDNEPQKGMYALGFLEAYFTCSRISIFYENYKADLFDPTKEMPSKEAIQFIEDNHAWLRKQADRKSASSDSSSKYWREVSSVLAQFDGMLAGYNTFCPGSSPMKALDLLLLNNLGDLYDVMPGLQRDNNTASGRARKFFRRSGLPIVRPGDRPPRCSAAVRLESNAENGTLTDIAVGHTTWDIFTNAFPRVFKHVSLPRGNGVTYTETFSSSPGLLSSMDDFYATAGPSSLFVMETSLEVLDLTKYRALSHKTVPCWIRVIVANRLATGGADWSALFSKAHSGTYNNQWMVVDRSRFEPGQPPARVKSDLFWVVEEAPSKIVAQDMTSKLLHDGYWASYNVPYFEEIRKALGYEGLVGEDFSYSEAPRAKQFRSLIPQAGGGLEGMHWLIRWNGWGNSGSDDPRLSSPAKAIAARGDLLPSLPTLDYTLTTLLELGGGRSSWGALDSKVASWSSWEGDGPAALIQLGPTTQSQPPFCWAIEFTDPHEGHPTCFDFDKVMVGLSKWMMKRRGSEKDGQPFVRLQHGLIIEATY